MLANKNDANDKRRCSAKTVKQNSVKNGNVYEISGNSKLPAKDFRSEHVFEVHLVTHFLEWLCGGSKELSYTGLGVKLPFPDGWTRPDSTWCAAVFGGKYSSPSLQSSCLDQSLTTSRTQGRITVGPRQWQEEQELGAAHRGQAGQQRQH